MILDSQVTDKGLFNIAEEISPKTGEFVFKKAISTNMEKRLD